MGFFLCLIRGFCGRESKAGPGEGKAGALFGQLLAVMHALLSPEWATWLRGNQVTAHAYLPFLQESDTCHLNCPLLCARQPER